MQTRPNTERFSTGVLVIGAGAAGLRASVELAERGLPVLCLTRCARDDAHTVLAAGGINAAPATTDHPDLDPAFQVNLTYAPGGAIEGAPIAGAPAAIIALARDTPELGAAGRLRE